jgi:hypothetical protein
MYGSMNVKILKKLCSALATFELIAFSNDVLILRGLGYQGTAWR